VNGCEHLASGRAIDRGLPVRSAHPSFVHRSKE
jgi:hypothetical protein